MGVMKKFLKISKSCLIIACVASVLYVLDALIAPLLVKNSSFMWVAFVCWTIFGNVSTKEKLKALIGIVIGYLAGVIMMLITSSFSLNVYTISISGLLGVFVVNFLVMYFENAEKIWLNSISGIFTGIFLTFSNLGCGLNPLNGWGESFFMLGIILIYCLLGLLYGISSNFLTKKFCKKNEDENTTN